MGEIIGGIIVVIIFIAFVIFKNKGKNTQTDPLKKMQEEEYWAEKNGRQVEIDSADADSDADGGDD